MSALVETVFWSSFRVPPLSSWRCCYCCYTTVAGRENWTAVRGRSSLAKHGVRLKFPTSSSSSSFSCVCVCVFCLIFLALFFWWIVFKKQTTDTKKREKHSGVYVIEQRTKKNKTKTNAKSRQWHCKSAGGKRPLFQSCKSIVYWIFSCIPNVW